MAISTKTVIMHYKPLVDRKANMIRQMEQHNFTNYSFYEEFDGNELTEDTINEYCCRKSKDWKTTQSKLKIYENLFPQVMTTQSELRIPEISLTIKHGMVFQELSKYDSEYFIILEDDAILCDNFEKHLNQYLSETPSDWDAIYIGSGCNLKPKNIEPNKLAYKMDHPSSKCSDSIIIKKNAITQLASTWFPFHLVIDWELGYQHYLHKHNVYWWEPSLVIQGSQCGLYPGSLTWGRRD
jgi:GR25 family glycosyltransferase involved in LPS biosynthesis